MTGPVRQPHAVRDLSSRRLKALKIERLLGLNRRPPGVRMLEVGCGSGGIAHYFGTHPRLRCEVHAVDVVDGREITDGYRFSRVTGVQLPFAAGAFDAVISNHVIEHVGEEAAQLTHLRELRRVMKPDGIGYLAVPNRWQLVEPHYRLPFLSWLPRPMRSAYVRVSGRGLGYDCEPLEMGRLERLLETAGLRYDNVCVEALRATLQIEAGHGLVRRMADMVPDAALHWLRPVIPTLIYLLRRQPGA